MSDVVECQVHGDQQATFVCRHLASALRTNENVGFFYADGPRGDAWCAACENARFAKAAI